MAAGSQLSTTICDSCCSQLLWSFGTRGGGSGGGGRTRNTTLGRLCWCEEGGGLGGRGRLEGTAAAVVGCGGSSCWAVAKRMRSCRQMTVVGLSSPKTGKINYIFYFLLSLF